MAAVMALSALPFTATEVQARSTNVPVGIPASVVPNNSVFVEMENAPAIGLGLPGNMIGAITPSAGMPYAIRGGYLEMRLEGPVNAGDTFRLDLDNAEWFFRAAANAVQGGAIWNSRATAGYGFGAGISSDNSIRSFLEDAHILDGATVVTGSTGPALTTAANPFYPGLAANEGHAVQQQARALLDSTTNSVGGIVTARAGIGIRQGEPGGGAELGWSRLGTSTHQGGNTEWRRNDRGAAAANRVPMTYDINRGVFIPNTPGNQGSYIRFGRYSIAGTTVGQPMNAGGSGLTPNPRNEVPYMLNVSQTDPRVATVHVLESHDFRTGDPWVIRIPLAIRVTSADDVTLTVITAGHTAFVTPGTHIIVSASGISTSAHVVDPVTARDRFEIERLVVNELRTNSVRRTAPGDTDGVTTTSAANAFDLVLPPGFYFENNLPEIRMFLEEGLRWGANTSGIHADAPTGEQAGWARHAWGLATVGSNVHWNNIGQGDFNIFFPDGYENNRNRLRVRLNNFVESQTIPGTIAIEGLVIWAEENAPFDVDVELELRNTDWINRYTAWTGTAGQGGPPAGWNAQATNPANWTWFAAQGGVPAGWVPANFVNVNGGVADPTGANTLAWIANWLGGANSARMWQGVSVPAPHIPFNQGGGALAEQNRGNMISAQTIRAAARRDWEVRLSTQGNIPELISGRYESPTSMAHVDHQTARVVFEEIVPNSWWAGRQVILNLPEEVRWRRVYFEEVSGTSSHTIQEEHTYVNISHTVQNLAGHNHHASAGQGAQRGVRFDANRMFWTDVLAFRGNNNQNDRVFIRFDAWVSIAAPFEGDIVLTATGSAVPEHVQEWETTNREGLPSTVIATAIPPVRVETSITDTRIGYQWQQTADIVITETRPGNLIRGRNVRLTVTDFVQIDTLFSPDVQIEVTGGNLVINNIGTGLAGSLFPYREGVPTLGVEANRGTLSFDIQGQSHGEPAVITVSNVSVRVDRTVPETNDRPFSVVVWGSAIANNFGHYDTRPVGQSAHNWPLHERTNNDRFANHPGIVTDYIRVVTGGDGSPWLTQEVRVSDSELYYTVNGVPFEMDVAAFIDPESNSMFVPLRFVANAFGLHDERDIVWDPVNRAVTIILPTGRVVQFQVDSPIMLDNGAPRNILNAAGQPITPIIRAVGDNDGGRTFLPFRFLGEVVFGVEVAWEEATRTAIFNPSANVTSE